MIRILLREEAHSGIIRKTESEGEPESVRRVGERRFHLQQREFKFHVQVEWPIKVFSNLPSVRLIDNIVFLTNMYVCLSGINSIGLTTSEVELFLRIKMTMACPRIRT